MEPLLDAAGVERGMDVLDVATGPGHVAAGAAARGARPVGIDISEGMLALARECHPGLEFRLADAEELPFGEGSFHAVAGNFVLNHLPQPARAARELARVLAPGGRVALSVWDRPERMRVMGVFADAMEEAGVDRSAHLPTGPDAYRFADERELERLLATAGLEDARVETVAWDHRAASADELWRGFMGSSVRTSALLQAQPEEAQRRIRAVFERLCEACRSEGALVLPVCLKIGSARRP